MKADSDRRLGPAFWIVMALALSLRLLRLGRQSFWADEIASVEAGRASLVSLIGWYQVDPHPPLFYFLVKLWLAVGDAEWWLRTISVLAGVLTVAVTWLLGRRLIGRAAATAGALLLTFHPMAIWLSQELRSMALLGFLSVLSVYLLVRYLDEGGRRLRAAYIAATVLMCYTHYYALFVLAFEALWVFLERRRAAAGPRQTFLSLVWIILLWAPWLPFFAWQFARGQSFRGYRTVGEVLRRTVYYFTTSHSPWKFETFHPWLDGFYFSDTVLFNRIVAALLLPFAVALAVGAVSAVRNRAPSRVLVWYALVPMVVVLAVSRMVYLFEPKYLIGVVPAACLLLGAGLVRIREWNRAAGVAVAGWVFGLMLLSLFHLYADPSYHRPDWRRYGTMITQRVDRQDAILVYRGDTMPDFRYYYEGDAPIFEILDGSEDEAARLAGPGPVREAVARMGRRRSVWFLDCLEFLHDPDGIAPRTLDEIMTLRETHAIRKEMGFFLRVYEPRGNGSGP